MYSTVPFSARPYSAARRGLFIDRRTTYPGEFRFRGEALTERIVETDAVLDLLRPVAVSQVLTVPL